MEKKITAYEIINHGIEASQYFQGCGTSYTEYEDVATGIGMDAKEAYEDAVESLASRGWNVETMPKRPRGINAKDKIPASYLKNEESEVYWYVSIRVR